MSEKWSREKAWQWYNSKPLVIGFNFIPSNTMGGVELWQEMNHEDIMKTVRHELEMAADLGLNSIRMGVPFIVWKQEHDGFMKRLDSFTEYAYKLGMTFMPVFFGDCCVPREFYHEPKLGKQPEPVKGFFGGNPVSPFDGTYKVGYIRWDDKENLPDMEAFTKDIVKAYAKDERVYLWNIWNEAGNCNRKTMSMPLLEKVAGWVREMDPIQPLSADVCGLNGRFPYEYLNNPRSLAPMEAKCVEISDIVTYHFYGDYTHTRLYTDTLRQFGYPMLMTEWMHRPFRSIIPTHLPLFVEENVGSYFFGFVNGKCQFNEPWDNIRDLPDIDLRYWMHDIFYQDGTPYDPKEIEVLRKYTAQI